jgi:hypothetical protein
MTLNRKPHAFEIIQVGKQALSINEGFVYKADTLERTDVKPISSEEGFLKPIWSTVTDNLQDLIFTIEGPMSLYIRVEHEKPSEVSFLRSCNILSAKVITDGEKAAGESSSDAESYSYINLAELDYDINKSVLSVKQKLSSDIYILVWGTKESA